MEPNLLIQDTIRRFQNEPPLLASIAKDIAKQGDGNALLTEFETSNIPEKKSLARLVRYFQQTQTVPTIEVFRILLEQIALYSELLKTKETLTANAPKELSVLVNSKPLETLIPTHFSQNEEGFYLRSITLPPDARHLRFVDENSDTLGYLPLLVLKATGATDQTIEFTPALQCTIAKHRDGWKIDVRYRLNKPHTSLSPEIQDFLQEISRKIQTFSGFYKAFEIGDLHLSPYPTNKSNPLPPAPKAPPPPLPVKRGAFFWTTISLIVLLTAYFYITFHFHFQ